MLRKAIVQGFSAAWHNPTLVICVWTANAVFGVVGAIPMWRWWNAAFARAPEADHLLQRFGFGTLSELAQYDRSPVWSIVLAGSFTAAVLSLLANPAMNGGVIEVLLERDERPLLHRFGRGAGHFYLRYLGLLAAALLSGGAAVGIALAGTAAAVRLAAESGWEPGPILSFSAGGGIAAVLAAFFYVALDYARIEMAANDAREVLRTWFRGVRFAWRNLFRNCVLLIVVTLVTAVIFAGYALFGFSTPSHTWGLIALTFAVQQIAVFLRLGVRTALVAAELEFYTARTALTARSLELAPSTAAASGTESYGF